MKYILKPSEFFISESESLKGPESGPSQEVVDFLNKNLQLNPHRSDMRMRGPGFLANGWTWNPKTQCIDVDGIVLIQTTDRIPPDLRFGVVNGTFSLKSNNPKNGELETIEFTPRRMGINGHLTITNSHLKTLKGCTPVVDGVFDCSSNALTSLEGSPQKVKSFKCQDNNLTSLKGISPNISLTLNVNNCINPETGENTNRQGLQTLKDGPTNLTGQAIVDGIYIDLGMWGKKEGWIQALKKLMGIVEISTFEIEYWFSDSPEGYYDDDDEYADADDDDATVSREVARKIPNRVRKMSLIIGMIPDEYKAILDSHIKQNPIDIDLLDGLPEIKAGVLQRTGLKDLSVLARSIRKGIL